MIVAEFVARSGFLRIFNVALIWDDGIIIFPGRFCDQEDGLCARVDNIMLSGLPITTPWLTHSAPARSQDWRVVGGALVLYLLYHPSLFLTKLCPADHHCRPAIISAVKRPGVHSEPGHNTRWGEGEVTISGTRAFLDWRHRRHCRHWGHWARGTMANIESPHICWPGAQCSVRVSLNGKGFSVLLSFHWTWK